MVKRVYQIKITLNDISPAIWYLGALFLISVYNYHMIAN